MSPVNSVDDSVSILRQGLTNVRQFPFEFVKLLPDGSDFGRQCGTSWSC